MTSDFLRLKMLKNLHDTVVNLSQMLELVTFSIASGPLVSSSLSGSVLF